MNKMCLLCKGIFILKLFLIFILKVFQNNYFDIYFIYIQSYNLIHIYKFIDCFDITILKSLIYFIFRVLWNGSLRCIIYI